jgi:CTP synthase (UTP-ammonia lyase)
MLYITPQPPRLALVGDRSATVAAHEKIPVLIESLGLGADEPIELYWLHSTSIVRSEDVALFDGIWVIPGSPYEHRDGVLAAIETARTSQIPLLGTCGGFQHVVLEFARNVCGLPEVEHGEEFADAEQLLIVPLSCSLLGEEGTVVVAPGTTAARAMGAGSTTERFFCRFGLNRAYLDVLEANGLMISGRDEFGEARVVELADHPFYVGSLFQPELSSDASWVHPLIASFAAAVRAHANAARSAADGDRSHRAGRLEQAS